MLVRAVFETLDMKTLSVKFAVGLWVIQDFAGLFNGLEGNIDAAELGWLVKFLHIIISTYAN